MAHHDPQSPHDYTDFGNVQVTPREKTDKVGAVFTAVAPHYDLMNDLMSLGLHRWWKRFTIELSAVKTGQRVLDVAGGTGDLAQQFAQRVGASGQVVLADINFAMLAQGRSRLENLGLVGNLHYVRANAECLPFPDDYFDCVSIAFGLRNVTYKERALQSLLRVLKPGGQLLVLEFSRPTGATLRSWYDFYSFNVLPKLGEWVANDAASYRYLVESIRKHPDQTTLKQMLMAAGAAHCIVHNLCGGIVALHRAYKA